MPCYDAVTAGENELNRSLVPKLRERNDMLARMLCKSLACIEDALHTKGGHVHAKLEDFLEDAEIKHWWEEHKKFDQARKGE